METTLCIHTPRSSVCSSCSMMPQPAKFGRAAQKMNRDRACAACSRKPHIETHMLHKPWKLTLSASFPMGGRVISQQCAWLKLTRSQRQLSTSSDSPSKPSGYGMTPVVLNILFALDYWLCLNSLLAEGRVQAHINEDIVRFWPLLRYRGPWHCLAIHHPALKPREGDTSMN